MKMSKTKSNIIVALLLIFGFLLTLLIATAFFYTINKKDEGIYMELHTAPYISQQFDKPQHISSLAEQSKNTNKEKS